MCVYLWEEEYQKASWLAQGLCTHKHTHTLTQTSARNSVREECRVIQCSHTHSQWCVCVRAQLRNVVASVSAFHMSCSLCTYTDPPKHSTQDCQFSGHTYIHCSLTAITMSSAYSNILNISQHKSTIEVNLHQNNNSSPSKNKGFGGVLVALRAKVHAHVLTTL